MDDLTLSERPVCEALESRILLDGGISDVRVADDVVVWRAWDGQDYEIFAYDAGGLRQLTDNDVDDDAPQIDNGRIVWEGFDGQDYEIFLFDGSVVRPLTDNTRNDHAPQIDGETVVYLSDDGAADQVMLHDLTEDTVTQLTTGAHDAHYLRITDGQVTWYASDGLDFEIYLYNDASGVLQLTDNSRDDLTPSASATHVVWRANDGDDDEIFLYDIAADAAEQITDNDYHDGYPGLTDSAVIFAGRIDGDYEIFAWDLAGPTLTRLTENDGDDRSPQIAGDAAVWIDSESGQIFRYDAAAGMVAQVTVDAGAHATPAGDGDLVVWSDGDRIGLCDTLADDGVVHFTHSGRVDEPLLWIDDVQINEGNGPTALEITVRLSGPTDHPVTFHYATADGSAVAGDDYVAASGELTFLPGDVDRTIRLESSGDLLLEPDEHFTLRVTAVSGAVAAGGDATVTLLDDDTPAIHVDPATMIESDQDEGGLAFCVWLSRPIAYPVTVAYATEDVTADADDYTATTGVLTFEPGQPAAQTVFVPVADDDEAEDHETLRLVLSEAENASVATASATGTILNDDTALSFDSESLRLSKDEGADEVTTNFNFTLELSHPSALPVTVAFTTADSGEDDAATADTDTETHDYQPTEGVVTFEPGRTSQTISVPVHGDDVIEAHQTFAVELSEPTNATILTERAVGEIFDDDAPRLTIGDVTVYEGSQLGSAEDPPYAEFTITLDKAGENSPITVAYETAPDDGSGGTDDEADHTPAAVDEDYLPTDGVLTFEFDGSDEPDLTQTVRVPLVGDLTPEDNETFLLVLSAAEGAVIFDDRAVATIENDDTEINFDPDSLTITQPEGDAGAKQVHFDVVLSHAITPTVTCRYITADGSADGGTDSGDDYRAVDEPGGIVHFVKGEDDVYRGTIAITVVGDADIEPDQTFTVTLIDPVGGVLGADAVATGVIADDDTPTVSITDATITEGDDGVRRLLFTASLSKANNDQAVTVTYATDDDDGAAHAAEAGLDYTPVEGTLTFPIGATETTFTVDIVGDEEVESSETFAVRLSAPNGARLDADSDAVGRIDNNDTGISIADVSYLEGTGVATTAMRFEVTLTEPSAETVEVWYMTLDGDAELSNPATMDDNDYLPVGGRLTFEPGETRKTFTVPVVADEKVESNEIFTVRLYNADGATITRDTADAEIRDDDVPWLTVDDVAASETNSGVTTMEFTVTVHGAHDNGEIRVEYVAAAGETDLAAEGDDFEPVAGELVFAPDQRTQTVSVTIYGDAVSEPDETFHLLLSRPTNAVIADAEAIGTIRNDDAAFSIADAEIFEGDDGTPVLSFAVSLAHPSAVDASVRVTTSDDTAEAGADYETVDTTLTFAAGVQYRTIDVPLVADGTTEADERFFVTLTDPAGATIDQPTAAGSILNDDAPPQISVESNGITEGNSGSTVLEMVLTLSNPSALPVQVRFDTADVAGGAKAGSDYQSNGDTVTFQPGQTRLPVEVLIYGDAKVEPAETFELRLSKAVNATILTDTAVGTIANDDTQITIADELAVEGDADRQYLTFTASLSGPTAFPVTFAYAAVDGTALAGDDFDAVAGEAVFQPGDVSCSIRVPILGDTITESDEMFTIVLSEAVSGPTNAVIDDAEAIGTIRDNDAPPTISIAAVSIAEGDAGSSLITFTASLSHRSDSSITVDYATADGTAEADLDYRSAAGELRFPPLTLAKTITVPILGDTIIEGDETFWLTLSSASGATIETTQVGGTILDDDGETPQPPHLSIDDMQIPEGDEVFTSMAFTVHLDAAAATTITVDYATADLTAEAGTDYGETFGTLIFAPGQTTKTIHVPIAGDGEVEGDEVFTVTLSNPAGAVMDDAEAAGVIVNDDEPAAPTPAADLAVALTATTLEALTVPGDAGKAAVTITNVGDVKATGKYALRLYISADAVLDESDLLLTETKAKRLNLAPGKTVKQNVKVVVPLAAAIGTDYRLLAEWVAVGETPDADPANNTAAEATTHQTQWVFGAVEGRAKPVKLVVADAAGTAVTLTLSGGGWGEVVGAEAMTQIVLHETTASSKAKIATRRGAAIALGGVTAADAMKSFTAKTTTITGDAVFGDVGSLAVGDVAGATITLGDQAGGAAATTIKAGRLTDVTIAAAGPIKMLTATEWLDSDGEADVLQAASLQTLKITGQSKQQIAGDFQAGVDLGGGPLGSATVAGDVTGAWTVGSAGKITIGGDLDGAVIEATEAATGKTNSLDRLTVKGVAADSTVRAAGDIGKLMLGQSFGGNFFAGLAPAVTTAPASGDDFLNPDASIDSITITGVGKSTERFVADTCFAAASLGKVRLLNADSATVDLYVHNAPESEPIRSLQHVDRLTGRTLKWPAADFDDVVHIL